MNLPSRLQSIFEQQMGSPPSCMARSIYDWEGNLGEAFVAASKGGIIVFSKPSGGAAEHRALVFRWPEITAMAARHSTAFSYLTIQVSEGGGRRVELQFTSWDGPSLDSLVQLRIDNGPPMEPMTEPESVDAPAAGPSETATGAVDLAGPGESPEPLEAFCAAVHAIIDSDAEVGLAEIQFLSRRVNDPSTIESGRQWLDALRLEGLLRVLPTVLSDRQAACLYANLLGVAMADGLLRGTEQEMLALFRQALSISEPDHEGILRVLMTKNRLAVFATDRVERLADTHDDLPPVTAFCAAMHAMMRVDDSVTDEELVLLTESIPYPEAIHDGAVYLETWGLEHLLAKAAGVLSSEQKACLAANMMELMMIDGLLRSSEQQLLDQFTDALGVTEFELSSIREVLMTRSDLSVFAA